MGGAGVAQQLARLAITTDQQAVAILGEGLCLAIGGETGRAVRVVAGRTAITQDQRLEEGAQRDRKSTRSELQSLMRNSYAVFCLKKKNKHDANQNTQTPLHISNEPNKM